MGGALRLENQFLIVWRPLGGPLSEPKIDFLIVRGLGRASRGTQNRFSNRKAPPHKRALSEPKIDFQIVGAIGWVPLSAPKCETEIDFLIV